MEPNKNQMLLIISFFAVILFNPEQVLSTSSAPSNSPNLRPVSSPKSQPTHSSPPAQAPRAKEYLPISLPSFWANLKVPGSTGQSSAPSPSANPPQESPTATHRSEEMPTKSPGAPSTQPDSAPPSATDPHIKKICDSTDHPARCVSFITPFFDGKSDHFSVLEMAIKATTHKIKSASDSIAKLDGVHNMHSAKKSNIEDCKDSYEDALENLQNALNAIPNRDIGTVTSMLSAAVTDFSDCDDSTANFPSMVKNDVKLSNLVSNCLAIAASID